MLLNKGRVSCEILLVSTSLLVLGFQAFSLIHDVVVQLQWVCLVVRYAAAVRPKEKLGLLGASRFRQR